MELKEFTYKGKKIVYRTKGEGPLLVLLHGFGEDGTVWKNQYHLFPNHQLIIPNLPGTGESEMSDDMSMEGMADAIYYLIEDLTANPSHKERGVMPPDWSKVSLIGHSMGGYIALAFAEKHPEALNALGLFHSTAFADSDEKKQTRCKGIETMREKGAYEFLVAATAKLYAASVKEQRPQLIDQHLGTVRNAKLQSLVSYYEAMMNRPGRTDVLINSKVPVLFVFGKYDTAVPLEDGLKQCHLSQLSYIHILQNSGHMGMIEEDIESNKILVEFITNVENLVNT